MHICDVGHGGRSHVPYQTNVLRLKLRDTAPISHAPYVAFVGGTDIFGKYIRAPLPELVGQNLPKMQSLNLGCLNAGPDAFLNDAAAIHLAQDAQVCVVQIMGAHNMSNRYYAVHPRRNDRFLRATGLLRQSFPSIDFTEFSFTRHMLETLARESPDQFALLVHEVQLAWVARMRMLIRKIGTDVILLWFAERSVPKRMPPIGLGPDPLFVEAWMLDALRDEVVHLVDATPGEAALEAGPEGMMVPEGEARIAAEMLGPAAHRDAARALLPVLCDLL